MLAALFAAVSQTPTDAGFAAFSVSTVYGNPPHQVSCSIGEVGPYGGKLVHEFGASASEGWNYKALLVVLEREASTLTVNLTNVGNPPAAKFMLRAEGVTERPPTSLEYSWKEWSPWVRFGSPGYGCPAAVCTPPEPGFSPATHYKPWCPWAAAAPRTSVSAVLGSNVLDLAPLRAKGFTMLKVFVDPSTKDAEGFWTAQADISHIAVS